MARLCVRLTPRTKRDAIEGWRGDVLRVRVVAPPVGGKANEALLRLLAEALDAPRGTLTIVAGVRAREKTIEIVGLDESELRRRIRAPAR